MSEFVFNSSEIDIPYTLIKQTRRSLAMRFKDGHLYVYMPHTSSHDWVENWMRRKESWILKSYQKASYLSAQQSKHFLLNQEVHYVFQSGASLSAVLQGSTVFVTKRSSMSKENAITKLRHKWAHDWILPILKEESKRLHSFPSSVAIKSMKSSWGRCSSKGNISLSERLIDCDPEFIRYVCIHELAHLHHMNHSSEFWAWVHQAMPDYHQKRTLTPYHGFNHSL